MKLPTWVEINEKNGPLDPIETFIYNFGIEINDLDEFMLELNAALEFAKSVPAKGSKL